MILEFRTLVSRGERLNISLRNAQKGMGSLIPALALMAPAFWVAWIELIYSGEIYLTPSQPTSVEIVGNYALSTTAMACMLVAFGCVPRKVEKLLEHIWVVPLSGIFAGVATLWGLFIPNAVAIVLTGIFTSVLVVRFADVFAQANPKASLLSVILAQIVASFVYGYVLALPTGWRWIFMCLLPAIAGTCALFDGQPPRRDDPQSDQSITSGFVRFVCAILLFSIALNVVRGFYPLSVEMDAFSEARGNSSVLFFFAKMALALFVLLLPLKTNLGKLCYYGFVALAIFTLPLPLLGLRNSATLELFGCINALLNIVVWSLFAGVSYKSGRSPIRLFGWGWGFMSLGSVLGWLLGYGLFAAGLNVEHLAFAEVALLAVMLLSCMFVATWQVVDELFDPSDADSDEETIDRTLAASDDEVSQMACAECCVCPKVAQYGQSEEPARSAEWAPASATTDAPTVSEDEQQGPIPGKRSAGKWKHAAFEMASDKGLSRREADVMELLLKGHSKQRVAEELFIAYNTVRSHVRKVYVKCGVHSQQELIDAFENDYLHKRSE